MSSEPKSKSVLVVIADGSEEIESVCIIDTLRRAEIPVTVAKVPSATNSSDDRGNSLLIKASRGVQIVADAHLESVCDQLFDMIVLPGGLNGAKAFAASDTLIRMLKLQKHRQSFIGAICASPALVLAAHGLLGHDYVATCFPGLKDQFLAHSPHYVPDERVVVCGKLITSQGPGTSLEFALNLVAQLLGNPDPAYTVAKSMLVNFSPVTNKK